MTNPGISVVVPSFERLGLLENLLRTLARESNGLAVSSEVIVSDSSPEPLVPAVKGLCDSFSARYLRSRSRNPAVSRNDGIGAAIYPVILFVDSDCETEPGLLSAHITAYRSAKIGGVAGVTKFVGESGLGYRFMECTPYIRPFLFPITREKVSWAPASNISYRREALDKAGGFDESIPANGGEDVMLGWRVTGAGYDILCSPEAAVTHTKETWNSLTAAMRRAVKWGRADCHIVMAFPSRTRRKFHCAALLFLFFLPSAAFLAFFFGRLWFFVPAGWLAVVVAYKALYETSSRQAAAPFLLRMGGALLILAFEISHVLECLRRMPSAVFLAPAHDDYGRSE
ncbi:MAG: glycosyltransferase [bacterium]